jgi:hypothetical protein
LHPACRGHGVVALVATAFNAAVMAATAPLA